MRTDSKSVSALYKYREKRLRGSKNNSGKAAQSSADLTLTFKYDRERVQQTKFILPEPKSLGNGGKMNIDQLSTTQVHSEEVEAQHEGSSSDEKPLINDLPDEILELVFFANTTKELNNIGSLVHDPYRTTISTILVCRRWHDVATEYPALWSPIIDYQHHTPTQIERLLALSKSAALDVGEDNIFKHIRLRDRRGKAILAQIFQRSSTMRTLSLGITFAPWDFICKQFLQHPAPSLEFLNLITSCPFPDCLFPGPLFAEQAPRLRRFHLQRCLIDFSSLVLTNLTEISVMDILAPGMGMLRASGHPLKVAPSATGWLHILKTIPSLRYLTLSNAISPPVSGEGSAPDVNLPHLLFLTVGAVSSYCAAFYDHISIPPACGIRLRLTHSGNFDTQSSAHLLSFLAIRFAHWPTDTRDRYLQAKILTGDRIHFGNSRRVGYIWDQTEEAVIADHAASTADPLLWLVLNFDDSRVSLRCFNDLLSLYQPTYPTTTILDLWFDEDFVAGNADASWATTTTTATTIATNLPSPHILKLFTAVKALNLLERSPIHLLPILQKESTQDQILFPSLRSLRLTRTNFDFSQGTAYLKVLEFLRWRAQVHAPLVEVQLIESKISTETQRALAERGDVRVVFGSPSLRAEDVLDDDP